MDPEDLVKEIEEDISRVEHDFEEVKDENASGTMREKQERAENLIGEIHSQLKFLKEQVGEENK